VAGLTYDTYVAELALLAVVDATDTNFVNNLPTAIEYAELRIQRDLDLMNTSVSLFGPSYVLTAGNRNFSFSQDLSDGTSFVVSEQINLLTPAGSTDPEASTRVPLLPTTKEFLDYVYGSSIPANWAQPKYFVPFNETLFLLGPVPDEGYYVEVIGTVRMAPLSATNTTTFISKYLPDLFLMASMVQVSGYQRNFGRQADDPQMALSYEQQYQTLLKGAGTEEARKKFEGPAWSSQSPAPIATPTRG